MNADAPGINDKREKSMNAEQQRLKANAAKKIPLEQWGPYVSERQWGYGAGRL